MGKNEINRIPLTRMYYILLFYFNDGGHFARAILQFMHFNVIFFPVYFRAYIFFIFPLPRGCLYYIVRDTPARNSVRLCRIFAGRVLTRRNDK